MTMAGLRFYVPERPALTEAEFPESIRSLAQRTKFAGCGTASAPYVMGWVVPTNSRDASSAYDDAARTWLKEHGFRCSGGKWALRDDVADEHAMESESTSQHRP